MPCVLLRPSGEPRSFPITTLSPLPPVSTLSLPPAHFLFVPFILFMFPTLSFFNSSGKQGSVTPLPSHGSIPSSSLSIFLYYHRGLPFTRRSPRPPPALSSAHRVKLFTRSSLPILAPGQLAVAGEEPRARVPGLPSDSSLTSNCFRSARPPYVLPFLSPHKQRIYKSLLRPPTPSYLSQLMALLPVPSEEMRTNTCCTLSYPPPGAGKEAEGPDSPSKTRRCPCSRLRPTPLLSAASLIFSLPT